MKIAAKVVLWNYNVINCCVKNYHSDLAFMLCCINRMAKVFPSEFNFVPKTWILPSEYTALQTYGLESKKRRKKGKTFIIKPTNGAMGNG